MPPGVSLINILRKTSTRTDPKRAKNTVKPSVFFVLLEFGLVKAATKTLVKLTPGDNQTVR